MDTTSWQRQSKDKPLFTDVLWSRPENKRHAGKLLIIGGNSHAFAGVGAAYAAAEKAGIGALRVVLPDALEKTLRKVLPEAEFAASTPSGSFARNALANLLEASLWADGVLLAGNFGKNSETAILLESLVEKFSGQLTLAGDSIDYFLHDSSKLVDRPKTLVVGELGQVQKLASPKVLIQQRADLIKVVEQLSEWTAQTSLLTITDHSGQIIVAATGKASTTPAKDINLTNLAAYASVWRLQQPEKSFEALTTAVYCFGL
jgi:NAD(P)H-hydrate repair Nnr-like enzyme with NAD(P)H-hydrate dehydratase domain